MTKDGIWAKAVHFANPVAWGSRAKVVETTDFKAHAFSRWIYLVFHGFFVDQCMIRASALTFTTILSIVPFIAVAFSISKGFGLQNADFIKDLLLRVTAGQEDVAAKILEYIGNTNVTTLGWMGVATLLGTVFSMVGTIEKAFNTIWDVKRGRTAWRKFTDFFSVILICPIIVMVAISLTVSLQNQEMVRNLLSVSAFGYMEALFLKLLPLFLIWMAFTFIYIFIPNHKVKLSSAAVGGVVAGSMWQLAQWVYIHWQIGAGKYNAIYGSFAQLPLLLIWLYISWVIVLLGAEMAAAKQNLKSSVGKRFAGTVNVLDRQKASLLLLTYLTRQFKDGFSPKPLEVISRRLSLPADLSADLFQTLREAGLVIKAQNGDEEIFVLAKTPDGIRVTDVMDAIAGDGHSKLPVLSEKRFQAVEQVFCQLSRAVIDSPANATLSEYSEAFRDLFAPKEPPNQPEGSVCGAESSAQ